jgi:hypothetical protein
LRRGGEEREGRAIVEGMHSHGESGNQRCRLHEGKATTRGVSRPGSGPSGTGGRQVRERCGWASWFQKSLRILN